MGFILGGSKSVPQAQQPAAAQGIRFQTALFGKPVPIVFGTGRVPANVIWYGDFNTITVTTGGDGGGGGGGGGKGGGGGPLGGGGKGGSSGGGTTSYQYYAALELGLCEGGASGIAGTGTVWVNKAVTDAGSLGMSLFTGNSSQSPWSYLTTNHPGQDLGYRRHAYAAVSNYRLTDQAEVPQHNFEILGLNRYGGGTDANPKDIVTVFLTDPDFGALFPSAYLGDITTGAASFHNYVVSNGILLSPVLEVQQSAAQILSEWATLCNSDIAWTDGGTGSAQLRLLPRGDTAVGSYAPNLTPIYSLNDDDFVPQKNKPPVSCTRSDPADAYNQVTLEIEDRSNQYASAPVDYKDQGAVDLYGLRPMPTIKAAAVKSVALGSFLATLLCNRQLYTRNQYTFQLDARYCLLEPGDLIDITDSVLGLNAQLVRILQVDEAEDNLITFITEEMLVGTQNPPLYNRQSGQGAAPNYNVDPGASNAPLFIEAPVVLTTSGLELWLAYSGLGSNWAGADVYISQDNSTYAFAGRVFGKSRMGVLTAAFASNGLDPDTADQLKVDLTESSGSLLSGTQNDADLANTLCYVDGEFISYQTATLTATNKYTLGTYLRRGLYNSVNKAHMIGTNFARLDDQVLKVPYTSDRIGTSVWVKLIPINPWGSHGPRSLATEPAYQYNIQGTALLSTLPAPTGVTTKYIGGYTNIVFTPVDDFRSPDYEFRIGTSWAGGQVLGRVPAVNPAFITQGDGTYWIASHYRTPDGTDVYSSPISVVLAGSVLTKNVIATWDEAATHWSGTLTPNAGVTSEGLVLYGAGNILTDPDFLGTSDILHYGGIANSGAYEIPTGHVIDIGRVAPCNVIVSYTVHGVNVNDNILVVPDFLGVTDFLNAAAGTKVSVIPQIRTANDAGHTWGAWQNFTPGAYNARAFDMRVLLASSDPQIYPAVSGLTFAVDVPDRLDSGTNVALAAGGTTFTYSTPFNGGPNSAATPNVQITILNAQAGDDLILSGQTVNGFTAQVVNGGVGVARNINWAAQGY